MSESWLPSGFQVSGNITIKSILASREEWQILSSDQGNRVLLLKPRLYNKLGVQGLLDPESFERIAAVKEGYYLFVARRGQAISNIQTGPFLKGPANALSFAAAIKKTRDIAPDVPLHDAIYIQELSRLFPTFSEDKPFDDQTVLGTWLTGGVRISTDSFRRLRNFLSSEYSLTDLTRVISAAGMNVNLDDMFDDLEDEGESEAVIEGRGKFELPGRPELEDFFNDHIIDIVRDEEKYRRMGIEFPAATIIYGPPGCGKTFAVRKLAEFIGWPCYEINSESIASPFIHDTSKKISEVFDQAIRDAPSVLIIDEMEAYLTSRAAAMSSGLHHVEEIAEFLRRIPEAISKKVLIFAMTNMLEEIDPAIVRTGRFDHKIELTYPTQVEVELLLEHVLMDLPVSDDVDIHAISVLLAGHPFSDVTFVIREAGRLAVRQGKEVIDDECLRTAIDANIANIRRFKLQGSGHNQMHRR
ncbi:MAG: ATP-binding protein [Methanomicrobiales archaeon]|nr:ATP-binding protein [Methanomicrobiales archaeon]